MTVRELIERLQELPPDAQVWFPCIRVEDTPEQTGREELVTVEAVEYDRGSVVLE